MGYFIPLQFLHGNIQQNNILKHFNKIIHVFFALLMIPWLRGDHKNGGFRILAQPQK